MRLTDTAEEGASGSVQSSEKLRILLPESGKLCESQGVPAELAKCNSFTLHVFLLQIIITVLLAFRICVHVLSTLK